MMQYETTGNKLSPMVLDGPRDAKQDDSHFLRSSITTVDAELHADVNQKQDI